MAVGVEYFRQVFASVFSSVWRVLNYRELTVKLIDFIEQYSLFRRAKN